MPDLLAVVLVFWAMHQPRRVGMGRPSSSAAAGRAPGRAAGQHALAYTVLIYFAIMLHRRLLWFGVPGQAVQLLPCSRRRTPSPSCCGWSAGRLPGWSCCWRPCWRPLLWPVVSVLLLAPQRRAPDPDENRPLLSKQASGASNNAIS
jgi:rod shape-determining protein MreD